MKSANEVFLRKSGILEGLKIFDDASENIQAAHNWASTGTERGAEQEECCLHLPLVGVNVLAIRQPPFERIKWLNLALTIAENHEGVADIELILNHLGLAYQSTGQHPESIELFERELALAEEANHFKSKAAALGNLGQAHVSLGHLEMARDYYEKAMEKDRQIGNDRGESNALSNIGHLLLQQNLPKEAIPYIEKALSIDRSIGNTLDEGKDLENLGLAYAANGDLSRAISH